METLLGRHRSEGFEFLLPLYLADSATCQTVQLRIRDAMDLTSITRRYQNVDCRSCQAGGGAACDLGKARLWCYLEPFKALVCATGARLPSSRLLHVLVRRISSPPAI